MNTPPLCRRLACIAIAVCASSFSEAQTVSTAALNQAGISQALHERIAAANAMWQKREGAGLQAALGIAKGKPTLSLEIFSGEQAEELARRKLAILAALDFILAEDGFDRVRISITESAPRQPYERTAREVEITRAQFQATATTIAKAQSAPDAVKVSRRDRTVLDQICAQLGIR